jgi:Glycosyltransferase
VTAIAPEDEYSKRITQELPCQFITLNHMNQKGTRISEDYRLFKEFKAIFSKNQFDVILSYTIKPNVYGNLAATAHPFIINTVNGLGYGLAQDNLLSRFLVRLYKIAFKRSNMVFFQNADDQQFFLEKKILTKEKASLVNGSGIDLQDFPPKKTYHADGHSLRFLLCARLVKEKGILLYLEAAQQLKKKYPNCLFALAGMKAYNPSAIDEEILVSLHQEGIIDYLGAVDHINALLENYDVLVLPSYYREGIPRILLEGLSKGLPIITTNFVGCKETIKDNWNGYAVEPNNTNDLIDAMQRMIELPLEYRKQMGEHSRSLAEEKFDVHLVNNQYLQVINRHLGK